MNTTTTSNGRCKWLAAMVIAATVVVVLTASESASAQIPLGNGVARVIHSGAPLWRDYRIDVPNNARRLRVRLAGGGGNAGLWVRHVLGSWLPPSTNPGNNECIDVDHPPQGRWIVRVRRMPWYNNATLVARYEVRHGPHLGAVAARSAPAIVNGLLRYAASRRRDRDDDRAGSATAANQVRITPLTSGEWASGLCGDSHSPDYFRIVVPRNTAGLVFLTRGGAGNCRLLVRRGTLPTDRANDCASRLAGTIQALAFDTPTPGVYYARLVGNPRFVHVALKAEIERAAPAPLTDAEAAAAAAGLPTAADSATPGALIAAAPTKLAFITPGNGATVTPGRTCVVMWEAPACVRNVAIRISWDTGRTWQPLATLPARTGRFFWHVPAGQRATGSVVLWISDRANPTDAAARILTFSRP